MDRNLNVKMVMTCGQVEVCNTATLNEHDKHILQMCRYVDIYEVMGIKTWDYTPIVKDCVGTPLEFSMLNTFGGVEHKFIETLKSNIVSNAVCEDMNNNVAVDGDYSGGIYFKKIDKFGAYDVTGIADSLHPYTGQSIITSREGKKFLIITRENVFVNTEPFVNSFVKG